MPPSQGYNIGTEGKITIGDDVKYNVGTEKLVTICPIDGSSNFAVLNFTNIDTSVLDFTNLG